MVAAVNGRSSCWGIVDGGSAVGRMVHRQRFSSHGSFDNVRDRERQTLSAESSRRRDRETLGLRGLLRGGGEISFCIAVCSIFAGVEQRSRKEELRDGGNEGLTDRRREPSLPA